jgi:hypothetical protein
MKKHISLTLVLVLSLGCSRCLGDEYSARRYAEVVGHDDLFLTACLLERADVQQDLKMTAEQIATIKHIWNATQREIPGLVELVAGYRKRQLDPTLSPSDKDKLREAVKSEVKSCINAYRRKELPAALSVNQRQRLGELVMQMRGPIAVCDDPALSSQLQLSEKQRAKMGETVKHYEAGLGWLRARFGRQQISGIHKNETQEERQNELEALFVVIRAIEKERDADLFVELTSEQLASWGKVQGRPLPIAWPRTLASDSPFENEEGRSPQAEQPDQRQNEP